MEHHDEMLRCAGCRRELVLGADIVAFTKGVLGHRGIVPLEETRCYCSEKCLIDDVDGEPTIVLKRRIP